MRGYLWAGADETEEGHPLGVVDQLVAGVSPLPVTLAGIRRRARELDAFETLVGGDDSHDHRLEEPGTGPGVARCAPRRPGADASMVREWDRTGWAGGFGRCSRPTG